MTETDRYTLQVVKRATKRKPMRRQASLDGELIVYCMRCLRSNYEVSRMVWEPFFCVCTDCIRDLAVFAEHLHERDEKA